MNIQKYYAFVKAVEYGSFTRAAYALGYTQSGISHIIGDLESEWGVSLLERRSSGVRATSEGLKLLPFAQNICREYERLMAEVEGLHGLQSGLIRIGTFSSVATHWLPDMIKAFKEQYPNIEFELLLGDYIEIEGWVTEGRVDCGFLRLPTKARLDSVFVGQDRLMAILPSKHPLAALERFPLAALEAEPFMLLEKGTNTEISEIFERHGIRPHIGFTTWDDYSIMAMVENGLGISILPELILQRTSFDIVAKELEVPACRRIGVAIRDAENLSSATTRFMDFVRERHTQ